LPIATIKREVCYSVEATNLYKCAARDTLCVKVFCEGTQVFIPNAFTPDGDGVNDILMVRAQGIRTVKNFRIFNRWGQVVFERNNFAPNDVAAGWDGTVGGKPASPDVYVYTCEVVCENDISYTYKGNVSIVK
jgi:gliding motility-associated-like protein